MATSAFIQGKAFSGTSVEVSVIIVTDTSKSVVLCRVAADDPTPLATLADQVRREVAAGPLRKSTTDQIVEGAPLDLTPPIVVVVPPSADDVALDTFRTALRTLKLEGAHKTLDPTLQAQYDAASKAVQARMDVILVGL